MAARFQIAPMEKRPRWTMSDYRRLSTSRLGVIIGTRVAKGELSADPDFVLLPIIALINNIPRVIIKMTIRDS